MIAGVQVLSAFQTDWPTRNSNLFAILYITVSASICQKVTPFSQLPSASTILLTALFTQLYLSKPYKTVQARIQSSFHPFSSKTSFSSFTLTSLRSINLCIIDQNSIFFPSSPMIIPLFSTMSTSRTLVVLILSISVCTCCHFFRLAFLQTILDQSETSSRSNITSPLLNSEARAVNTSIKKWQVRNDCLTMMAGLEMLSLLFLLREHPQSQCFCPCRKEQSEATTMPFQAEFKAEADLCANFLIARKK